MDGAGGISGRCLRWEGREIALPTPFARLESTIKVKHPLEFPIFDAS